MSNCIRFHNEGLFFLSSNPLKVVMQQYSGTIIFLIPFSSFNLQEEGWQSNVYFSDFFLGFGETTYLGRLKLTLNFNPVVKSCENTWHSNL